MMRKLMVGRGILGRVLFAGALALGVLLPRAATARADDGAALPAIVYIQNQCVQLYSTPSADGTVQASAIPGTGLRVTGASSDGLWYHALFLGAMPVWVQVSDVGTGYQTGIGEDNTCPFRSVSPIVPVAAPTVAGPYALTGAGIITQFTQLRSAPSATARVTADLLPGAQANVTQWSADANGDIWYLAHVQGTLGWVWAYALLFSQPDPSTYAVNGVPVWSAAAGKGLWFTDYLTHHTDLTAMMEAAKALGITHIYPRVAESSYGFYDGATLNTLLPIAHKLGIKVLAWVYPYLNDVASDVLMTRAVLAYRTPTGDHVDGIGADVETRVDAPAVYAYGQVLRQMVGPSVPLVITTYNPRARPYYPYAEAATSFNVIAPMDYWHNTPDGTFDASSARALLTISVTTIRAD